MSWGTCYSGSNNIHFDFPAIMADGRNYSSWQPDAVINQRIQQKENIHSSWQYRQFLTNNAQQIMKYNSMESCYALGLPEHIQSSSNPATNVPFKYNSNFDNNEPGFGYCNSDLKNPYLSREQLQSRMISATVNPNPNA
jgi:hypothetical protein